MYEFISKRKELFGDDYQIRFARKQLELQENLKNAQERLDSYNKRLVKTMDELVYEID